MGDLETELIQILTDAATGTGMIVAGFHFGQLSWNSWFPGSGCLPSICETAAREPPPGHLLGFIFFLLFKIDFQISQSCNNFHQLQMSDEN